MARQQGRLKLGKGSAFIKKRLLRLPQADLIREADYCPLPESLCGGHGLWLGILVSHDASILAQEILEHAPTVNDFGKLLANAMQRPLTDERYCRPKAIHVRDNPEWEELFPHLEQLDIEIVVTEDLRVLDKTVAGLVGYLIDGIGKETTGGTTGDVEDEDGFQEHLLNLRLAAILYPAMQHRTQG